MHGSNVYPHRKSLDFTTDPKTSEDYFNRSTRLSKVGSMFLKPPRLSLYSGGLSSQRSYQASVMKIKEEGVPGCINWTAEMVGNWIESLGFPHYKHAFKNNFINGKRLILVNASTLPKMGIHDFEDIKTIMAKLRELLGIPFVSDDHSIADPYTNALGVYLEEKSKTTVFPSSLTYKEVFEKFECLKLKPPLYKIMNL